MTKLFNRITSYLKPRVREIHDEEWWLYMNPTGSNYVPFRLLIVFYLIINQPYNLNRLL